MPSLVVIRSLRGMVAAALACLAATHVTFAQQQVPPTPGAPAAVRPSAVATTVAPHVNELAARKSTLFKNLPLSEAQQNTLLGNLGEVGCQPMKVMQQTIPVPPALASGEACHSLYSGTAEQLVALRTTVERAVNQNKATDVQGFTANIPKDCPYRELYYYLDVLAALPVNR